jgi:prepilin-type N-terminal cleavage/methylation domain-containing protein
MKALAGRRRRAYTLVEMLIVVAILGIASAIVIPSVGQAGTLRGQSSVRAVVADLAFAQSDAMAFQSGRAVVFDVEENRYVVCAVNGASVDPETDALYDQSRVGGIMGIDLDDELFGQARLESVDIDGGTMLVFDEMGAPVNAPLSNSPSSGGIITIVCEDQRYTIVIDGFTGHITTSRAEIVGP